MRRGFRKQSSRYLKSNMDRFIAKIAVDTGGINTHLKSNMDRFIG